MSLGAGDITPLPGGSRKRFHIDNINKYEVLLSIGDSTHSDAVILPSYDGTVQHEWSHPSLMRT